MNERFTDPIIYRKQDEPPSGGEKEKNERTKESEIKANIEFWKGFGVEVDEEDIRREIESLPEVEGFDYYIYMPRRIYASRIISRTNDIFNQSNGKDSFEIMDLHLPEAYYSMPSPRPSNASYAIAMRANEEPDEDSIGKNAHSAVEWEQLPDDFMTLKERLVAGLRIYSESGRLLDPTGYATMFPHERSATSRGEGQGFSVGKGVPFISRNKGREKLYQIAGYWSDRVDETKGVRRIITKSTPLEVVESYRQNAKEIKDSE